MATIKDVARLAGVSVATVSRVINNSPKASEASRQSVGAAMETLNYHPNANARALAQQSTETVGLVVGDVSDPFFGAMVKAVEQVAYNTGNFLLIGNGYHSIKKERQAIEQLIRHRCAALVVHAKMIPDDELAGLMKQIPGMVLINRILAGFEQRCVALDDRYGAWLATRHLIQQGHTRIGNDSKIQSHTFICEYVTIGERCFIGHGVMFANVSRCVPSRKRVVNNVTTFVVLAGFNRSVALWLKSTSLLSA